MPSHLGGFAVPVMGVMPSVTIVNNASIATQARRPRKGGN
jgi:hypothetical protein